MPTETGKKDQDHNRPRRERRSTKDTGRSRRERGLCGTLATARADA